MPLNIRTLNIIPQFDNFAVIHQNEKSKAFYLQAEMQINLKSFFDCEFVIYRLKLREIKHLLSVFI